MYSFKNDYSEGTHPSILEKLLETNLEQHEGYGLDTYSEQARELIRDLVQDPSAEIAFIPGGTATNLLAIKSFLRPHEAVLSAHSGHIATHEAGAIEGTGHKILEIPSTDGKITPTGIEERVLEHHFEHMVKPKMIYISNPTELGTVYTKEEILSLREICDKYKLHFYMDGARLGSALMAESANYDLKFIHEQVDAYFIGGTKNGALLGEALVLRNNDLSDEFRYLMKQRGQLLAKGRVIGIQFLTLMQNNLLFELADYANTMATRLRNAFSESGFGFLIENDSNQLFPILDNKTIDELLKDFEFYVWQKIDEDLSAIRLITSWATPERAIQEFIDKLKELKPE